MPLGLCNVQAAFQRLMNDIFCPYITCYVLVYLGVLLVYSHNAQGHLQHLHTVLSIVPKPTLYQTL
eukprot:1152171-Pelagomonas_calceolata.AAC.14